MSHPEDNEQNDNNSPQGSYAERAAHRFLFRKSPDASAAQAATYPIGDVRKALWRTIQSSMGDDPKRTIPAEIMPGANDYILHLMQHLDRLDEIRATEVNISRLQFDAMEAQIRARRQIEDDIDIYVSPEIEAAANLSPGESAVTLGAAQMAVNACLIDSLTTPLPNPLPRAELGD